MRVVSTRLVLIALLILCAAQIQPQTTTIEGGADTQFSQIITITNTNARPVQYSVGLNEFSQYLSNHVHPTEETFWLDPQQSKNLQVSGVVPELGPETHKLVYEVKADEQVVANSTFLIPIEGRASLEPAIKVDVPDITSDESLPVTAELSNFGNIIAYYKLKMQIKEAGEVVGELTYPNSLQVLPGEQQEITLTYTDILPPGDYQVTVQAQVNAEKSISTTESFMVTLHKQSETVKQGEDLLVSVKRYDSNPVVRYSISRGEVVYLQEVLQLEEDELLIPTGSLESGDYQAQIQITSGDHSESQTFDLHVRTRSLVPTWVVYVLIISALVSFALSPSTRLNIKIALLSRKIHQREKRLNNLIHRAHELERRQ